MPLNYYSVTIVCENESRDIVPDDKLANEMAAMACGHGLWIASVERGAREGNLHFQCMMSSTETTAGQVTKRLKAWARALNAPYQVCIPC